MVKGKTEENINWNGYVWKYGKSHGNKRVGKKIMKNRKWMMVNGEGKMVNGKW